MIEVVAQIEKLAQSENQHSIEKLCVKEVSQRISNTKAIEMTSNYRKINPEKIHGHLIGKEVLLSFLEKEEVHGIRIYHAYAGLNESEREHKIVFVGVDENGKDIFANTEGNTNNFDSEKTLSVFQDAADFTLPVPPYTYPDDLLAHG